MFYPFIFIILNIIKLSTQTELVKFANLKITTSIVNHTEVVNRTQELKQNITNPCKSIKSCRVVIADLAAMDAASMNVPGCSHLIRTTQFQYYPEQSEDGSYESKTATYQNKNCIASFEASKDHVTGTVEIKSGGNGFGSTKKFVLESCDAYKGCHIWKELKTDCQNDRKIRQVKSRSKSKRPSLPPIMKKTEMQQLRQKGIHDNTTEVEFSVKFYSSLNFTETTPNITEYVNKIKDDVNTAFKNSKIPIRMKVHCIEQAQLSDKKDAIEIIRDFRIYKGEDFRTLLGGADAAALLVNQMWPSCGIARTDALRDGIAISVNSKSCIDQEVVVQHELGHSFGCIHDKETDKDLKRVPYEYGYGSYVNVNGEVSRTIMSYPKTVEMLPINYYSSPNIKYKGKITGSLDEDCARIIKENRFAIAAINDEQEKCK